MTEFRFVVLLWIIATLLPAMPGCQILGDSPASSGCVIVSPSDVSEIEILGASEVRRYVYLRTGRLLPMVKKLPEKGDAILVCCLGRIPDGENGAPLFPLPEERVPREEYILKTVQTEDRRVVVITGGSGRGTLYGAYRFAERLGVRFALHGDVVPDAAVPLDLPDLDCRGRPLFERRGIQPFHDFPEGPDWWNADDYKAVLAQLPKMGMNFFGLHTYPEGPVGPEPAVWIGPRDEIGLDGEVDSSYPSRHFTTRTGGWGYLPRNTGDYLFGAADIFERDDYGADYMLGRTPLPPGPEESNKLFNDFGKLVDDVFTFAGKLDIATCLGTETPLTVPAALRERLAAAGKDPADPAVIHELYKGIFERIMAAHPLDYYWFWTPEGWTWSGASEAQVKATLDDLLSAVKAASDVGAPFTLATCGWVLGPPGDRSLFHDVLPREMPLSCINRNVGFEPVEQGFIKVADRPKWAIPWLEDDPAMIIPQLWVGRMRRDAADSLAYGCTGLMGIHWRTRAVGPNVAALAAAAWNQEGWNRDRGKRFSPSDLKRTEGPMGGKPAAFPDNRIAGTEEETVYKTVRYDLDGYRLDVPDGFYRVTLKFCEPHYDAAGKRVFGARIQGRTVIEHLDIFAAAGKDRALDFTFNEVEVTDGHLLVEFVREVEFPSIAAIAVRSSRRSSGLTFERMINCAGPAWSGFEADLPASSLSPWPGKRPRDLPSRDFYEDWALAHFGPEAAGELASLFTRLDGSPPGASPGSKESNLPRPATWVHGPGGITPDGRPWKTVSRDYAFVDEMAALRPLIRGAGNIERFDYWLDSFRYLRALGRTNCVWARFNEAMKQVLAEEDSGARRELARELALPLRKELVSCAAEVHRFLLAIVTTTGAMGNVANWQQHLLPGLLEKPGEQLAEILECALPEEAIPSTRYAGEPRLFVPTVRTVAAPGEELALKAIVLGFRPARVSVHWRPMGEGNFFRTPLDHVKRGVYETVLPPEATAGDLEYYIEALRDEGESLVFPPTAPRMNQTVVVWSGIAGK